MNDENTAENEEALIEQTPEAEQELHSIDGTVGDDSRETYELVDDTPEISLQDLQKKIQKLDKHIRQAGKVMEIYEKELAVLTDIDPKLQFAMQNEVYGAEKKSTLYVKI